MKILIIKLNKIGDVLLVSPLIPNLKSYYGEECSIDLLVNKGTEGAISRENLRKIHLLERPKNPFYKLYTETSLLLAVAKERYDMAIGLSAGERTAFLSFWSGAKIRVGFPPPSFWSKNIYTLKLIAKGTHTIDYNLESLRTLKIPILHKRVSTNIAQSCEKFTKLPNHFVHLHLFSSWMFKCLADSFCAKIIDFITQTYQIPCVLTASNDPRESEKLQKILQLTQTKPLSFNGNLSLAEVSLLNSKALAFVGVDTGVMHLSAANDTPTFAFFGPTSPKTWGPWDNTLLESTYTSPKGIQRMGKHLVYQESLPCVPCGRDGCNGSKKSDCLLTKINEESALKTLQEFLTPLLKPTKS